MLSDHLSHAALFFAPLVGLVAYARSGTLILQREPVARLVLSQAFIGGLFATAMVTVLGFVLARNSAVGIPGLSLTIFASYATLALIHLLLSHQDEYALGARILHLLSGKSDGMSRSEILRHAEEDTLLRRRLDELVELGLVTAADGKIYVRSGFAGAGSRMLGLVSKALYRQRSQLAARLAATALPLLATSAAALMPSRSTHVTAGKLALISMLVTTFYLFTAGINFPGGALNFPLWAEAIVHGTTLPPRTAWREVGFPLLYILSGFPWTHSFIGILLILATFAVLMPVLVYWSLVRASPIIAFYMGLVCIISLAPVAYMKFLFHDQAYMFFGLLAFALLVEFLWTGRFRTLYFFTFAALAASFTRTAGNLMFPMLLTIAFVTIRGRFRHYLGCILVFLLASGVYQWHRYEIFDMRNQPSAPSGTGGQMFYSMYLYLGDFGYRLSPDLGPN
jgi:hypothetical protein